MKGFIFAGEVSGDRQGGEILKSLREQIPSLKTFGVGGPALQKEGLSSLCSFEDFQVMGFTDVFLTLPKLLLRFRMIKKAILEQNPDFALFIDSPSLSLRMQASLRKAGYKGKIIQHVCPSIWIWKAHRKQTLEKNTDLLTCLFSFEKELFKGSSLQAEHVGHPLLEKIEAHRKNHPIAKEKVLAIFPGSRRGEMKRNYPVQVEAAKAFLQENPDYTLKVSCCREEMKEYLQSLLPPQQAEVVDASQNYTLMQQAELAIATSGTITLEMGLFHLPTVITYQLDCLNSLIFKWVYKFPPPSEASYSLPNILLKQRLLPEVLGKEIQAEEILKGLHQVKQSSDTIQKKLSALSALCQVPANTKPSTLRTAEAIANLLSK